MSAPRDITVIIPARNAAGTVAATLASLAGGRELIAEVLLVDDASTDATAEVARRAAGEAGLPLTVIPGHAAGPGAARNRALERAAGEYVYFIDADDQLLPGGLQAMRRTLAADPTLVMTIGNHVRRIPGEPDRIKRAQNYHRGRGGNARAYLAGLRRPVQIGAALARRSAIGATRFPVAPIYDEDTCFWAQIVAKGDATAVDTLVAIYNASPERMEARFIATPVRSFLEVSRTYRELAGTTLNGGDVAVRRSGLALTVMRLACRRGDLRTARRFLRLVGWNGLPLRLKYRRFRYGLRLRRAELLAGQRRRWLGAPPAVDSAASRTPPARR